MTVQHFLAVQLGGGSAGWLGFAPLIFIFAIFYFLLIMPQQRRQKKWQAMLNELKTGDKVVTTGGLRGTIVAIKDDYRASACSPGQFADRSQPGFGGFGDHAGGDGEVRSARATKLASTI